MRYVLEGSVRKAGNRVRITGKLIDAASGAHLWADRFDGSLDDIFELQDKVASNVAGVIEPALQAAEIRRSSERSTSDLTAYDLYLRALPAAMSGEKNGYIDGLNLLGRSIERDPHFGPSLALAAVCHAAMCVSGWTHNPDVSRQEGVERARQALRYGGDDACTLARAAYALALFGEDIDAAVALVDRSLQINPSFAYGWQRSGWLRLWAENPDLGASGRSPTKTLSILKRRSRVRERRLAWRVARHGSGYRSILGFGPRGLDEGAGRRRAEV